MVGKMDNQDKLLPAWMHPLAGDEVLKGSLAQLQSSMALALSCMCVTEGRE